VSYVEEYNGVLLFMYQHAEPMSVKTTRTGVLQSTLASATTEKLNASAVPRAGDMKIAHSQVSSPPVA